MMKAATAIALAMLVLPGNASAEDDFLHEWTEPYVQRVEGVTIGAGNAKAANSAVHMIDPWPPYVGNRHIPANGARMVGAIERYKDVKKLPETPPTIKPDIDFVAGSGAATH
jgi:hypothetical protein